MGWTDANNGIAHDAGNWFFTNEEQLVKIRSVWISTPTSILMTTHPTGLRVSLRAAIYPIRSPMRAGTTRAISTSRTGSCSSR